MRGRVLVIFGFLLAAGLCAAAAIALVSASREDKGPQATLPSLHPTLSLPSDQPSATPTPTVTATPGPTPTSAPSPSATATPGATSSPSRRATSSPRPSATRTAQPAGLAVDAQLAEATGGVAGDLFHLTAHATDGDGSISLLSLDWGDGTAQTKGGRGSACSPSAAAPADCRNFAWTHTYATAGSFTITIKIKSGLEVHVLSIGVTVDPTPTPEPSATS